MGKTDPHFHLNMDPEPFATDFQVPMTQQAKKKRIRNWTAEDRALHREFEKSRREAFSESLMVGVTFYQWDISLIILRN